MEGSNLLEVGEPAGFFGTVVMGVQPECVDVPHQADHADSCDVELMAAMMHKSSKGALLCSSHPRTVRFSENLSDSDSSPETPPRRAHSQLAHQSQIPSMDEYSEPKAGNFHGVLRMRGLREAATPNPRSTRRPLQQCA